jgi:hypothetical protein
MQEEHDRALICAVNAYPDMPVDELTRKVIFEDVGIPQRGAIQPCPRCTNLQFALLGEASIPVGEEKGTILTGPYTPKIPVVVFVCKNCGYVIDHGGRQRVVEPVPSMSADTQSVLW